MCSHHVPNAIPNMFPSTQCVPKMDITTLNWIFVES
jgi:hypothetical protein